MILYYLTLQHSGNYCSMKNCAESEHHIFRECERDHFRFYLQKHVLIDFQTHRLYLHIKIFLDADHP